MLAEGDYRGYILNHTVRRNPNTQTPEIEFHVDVFACIYRGMEEPIKPSVRRRIWLPITPAASEWVMRTLKQLGFEGDLARLAHNHPQAFKFEGLEVTLRCSEQNYEGIRRERWSFAPQDIPAPADEGVMEELKLVFGALGTDSQQTSGTEEVNRETPVEPPRGEANEVEPNKDAGKDPSQAESKAGRKNNSRKTAPVREAEVGGV